MYKLYKTLALSIIPEKNTIKMTVLQLDRPTTIINFEPYCLFVKF